MGSLSLLQGDLLNPGIRLRSPSLQPDEPKGKPKNTGVGSISLLQQISPTRELNQGLLHCRGILYQLSYREARACIFLSKLIKERGKGRKEGRKVKVKVIQSCPTLCDLMDYTVWNSPGQNTGVGSHFLLRGIFPTQRWNSGLPHCRWILYQLSHQGSPGRKEGPY